MFQVQCWPRYLVLSFTNVGVREGSSRKGPWERGWCNTKKAKQQRRRRLRKRHLKSVVALLQTLSRLFHRVQFVKCWQLFLELNSKAKQRRRPHQRERQKSNGFKLGKQQLFSYITLFCTFLCRHCTTTTWKCLISRFMEDLKTRQRLSLSFPDLRYRSSLVLSSHNFFERPLFAFWSIN